MKSKSMAAAAVAAGILAASAGSAWAGTAEASAELEREARLAAVTAGHVRAARTPEARAERRERAEERTVVAGSDESGSYKVEMADGDIIRVEIDGKEVSPSRMKVAGDTVTLLGEDGSSRFRFKAPSGMGVFVGQGAEGRAAVRAMSPEGGRPRIGVTLSDVGEALAAQLGVDPQTTTMITSVVEGGPAAEAGLKPFDIIVKVEDSDRGSFEVLREVIAKKTPGENVKLRVLRRGEPREVTVRVEKVEGSISERGAQMRARELDAARWTELSQRQAEEARATAERLREQIQGQIRSRRGEVAQVLERIEQAFEKADVELSEEQMRALREGLASAMQSLEHTFEFEGMPPMRLFGEPGQNGVLVVPPTPAAPAAPPAPAAGAMRARAGDGERLERLEERMARMEELLRKLAERNP